MARLGCRDLALILWMLSLALVADACPPGCTCTMLAGKTREADGDSGSSPVPLTGRKVVCDGTHSPVNSVSQIQPPHDTVYWILTGHSISILPRDSFAEMTSLVRLDLIDNQISTIEPGAFSGLAQLQRLDLTNNKLGSVNSSMFEGLANLKRLSLSGNQLTIISEGTFDSLSSLERIDFQSEYLSCNCKLQWLVQWQKRARVRISPTTVCAVPKDLKGQAIRKLKKTDLHCEWPLELPLFELVPATSQIVFEGDRLPFECKASIVDPTTKVIWLREGHEVLNNRSAGHLVYTEFSTDKTVISKRLVLESLGVADTGAWKCRVQTAQGNVSKSVSVIVMSDTVTYCEAMMTPTNKGVFYWPKTVAGVLQDVQCVNDAALGYSGDDPALAYHRCDNQGQWQDLDVAQCRYESEVTRELETVAQFDLYNMTRLANKADQVISDAGSITDKMDVVFTVQILEKLSEQVPANIQLADVVIHLISMMMDVDAQLLLEAQRQDKACTRMLEVLEQLPKQLLLGKDKVTKSTPNIVVHARTVDVQNFEGITCATYGTPGREGDYAESSFSCTVGKNSTVSHFNDSNKLLEASIHLPPTIFKNIHWTFPDNDLKMLQFVSYKNAKLFPVDSQDGSESFVPTAVMASKIGGATVLNTTSPIVIQLSSDADGSNKRAVYWDFLANNGNGDWVSRGCSLHETRGSLHTLHCSHLTNFAILQDPPILPTPWESWLDNFFNTSPAVYAGTGILVLCTLTTIISYITCHSDLKMSAKAKHSIANMCASLLLLCVSYTLGVRTRRPLLACQMFGVAIHYFSLCTLFWIAITSYNMYKKFNKAEHPPPPPSEPMEAPLPKPMLRFYLVGWGVAQLICGIATAINLGHYSASEKYCFLTVEPAIAPFFIPVALIIFITCAFFCCICCVVRGTKEPLNEPETEEVNDLEMINNETTSMTQTNASNLTAATSVMDLEYRPVTQLRAIAFVLLLYILTWTSGAFAVSQPFTSFLPHQDIIFSYMYAIFCTVLGIFIYVFYCLGRTDARHGCRRCCCCSGGDNKPALYEAGGPQDNIAQQLNGHVVRSSNSIESFSSKSNNTAKQNGSALHNGAKKPSNVNLISSQTGTLSDPSMTSAQELVFYNPRQNGVARKYWQKNRHQKHLCQLNRDFKNTDSGHSSQALNERGSNSGKCNRHSYGSSGDGSHGNAGVSLLEPLSCSGLPRSRSPSSDPQNVVYNSLGRPRAVQPSPLTLQQPVIPIERYHIPISRGNGMPPYTQYPPPDGGSCVTSGHTSPEPEAHTVLQPPPPVNIAAIAPVRTLGDPNSHTLPKPNEAPPPQYNEYMQRNGSVTRLRDFDGQSSVSQEPQGVLVHSANVYTPPYLTGATVTTGVVPPQPAPRPLQHPQPREIFIDCPGVSDPVDTKRCSVSPDNRHSPSAGSSQSQHSAEQPRTAGKPPPCKIKPSAQKIRDWEEEFKDRPRQPGTYAYINRDYQEQVVHKLLRQQSESGGEGINDSSLNWMPRSVSAYDQVTAAQTQPMLAAEQDADESSSLSSESGDSEADEVWVMQRGKKKKRNKFKKETSV